ncbi:MAG: hypothetical protein CVV64_12945 [Candidatus Wallbacteria bacterium HGW-Wallbacteria-1]|jgi:hypothetical protein|uniref:PABS domain-containing protein n=1 Tax=Candidatus Wallbacteria bacterium HGW-Wallbacteria-1 TaxID=2013854 RepID=A0A2N1PMZ5_9BACT|nr:MAG: hypothetical protein CVV64_12945 [Candidatus Wallbacteria bacterium HGW-Wallbacteria-1]
MQTLSGAALGLAMAAGLHEFLTFRLAISLFSHHAAFLTMAMGLMALAWGALLPLGSARGSLIMALSCILSSIFLPLGTEAWYLLLFTVPFMAFGAVSADLYRKGWKEGHKTSSTRISPGLSVYALETLGFAAGLGILGPLLMDRGGFFSCGLAAGAICLWIFPFLTAMNASVPRQETIKCGPDNRLKRDIVRFLLPCSILLMGNHWAHDISVAGSKAILNSENHLALQAGKNGVRSLETFWNSMARTDLMVPEKGSMSFIYTDGMFCSRIPTWDGCSRFFPDEETEFLATLKRFPFRVSFPPRGSVMIAGAAGGFDSAVAMQEGAARIHAIEINEKAMEITRSLTPWIDVFISDQIINHQNTLQYIPIVDDARSWLEKRSREKHDLLLFSLMETWAGGELGRAHLHTRLFTLQAAGNYLNSCTENGCVAVIQNTSELAARTVNLFREALKKSNNGLVVLLGSPSNSENHYYNPFSFLVMAFPHNSAKLMETIRIEAGKINAPEPVFIQIDQTCHPNDPTSNNPNHSQSSVPNPPENRVQAIPTDWRPFFYAGKGDSMPMAAACLAALLGAIALAAGRFCLTRIREILNHLRKKGLQKSIPAKGEFTAEAAERTANNHEGITAATGIAAFTLSAGAMGFQGCALYWAQPIAGNPSLAWRIALPCFLAGAALGSRLPLISKWFACSRNWVKICIFSAISGTAGTLLLFPWLAAALTFHPAVSLLLLAAISVFTALLPGLPTALLITSTSNPGAILASDGLGMVFGASMCGLISVELGYEWVSLISALLILIAAAAGSGSRHENTGNPPKFHRNAEEDCNKRLFDGMSAATTTLS